MIEDKSFIYFDQTEDIINILSNLWEIILLTRPRSFGKTFFLKLIQFIVKNGILKAKDQFPKYCYIQQIFEE